MCFPVKFLKVFIQINCYMFITVGIATIVSSFFLLKTQVSQNALLQAIIGIIVVILGLAGLIGQRKQNICYMTIYNGGMLIIGSISIFITFALLIMEKSLQDHQLCSHYMLSNQMQLEEQTKKAAMYFCKMDCVCYINSDLEWPSPHYLYDNRIISTQKHDDKSIIRYSQCPNRFIVSTEVVATLQRLEDSYQCSGWCKPEAIYLFSDVNDGVPQANQGCYDFYLREYKQQVFLAFLIYMALDMAFIINLSFACCLCFHPRRKTYRIHKYIEYEVANF